MKLQKNLHHAVVLRRLLVNLLHQFQAIHRLNHGDIRGDVLHLVGLKMTDKMPLYVLRQGLHLLGKFLLMALAEDALTFGVSSLNILVGMKLADSHQSDTSRQAAQHLMKISFYIIHSSIIFAPRILERRSSPPSSRQERDARIHPSAWSR